MSDTPDPKAVADAIMALVERRGEGRTICPSEVARSLSADWRALMPLVREVAATLARDRLIQITQRGKPLDPDALRGAIRLGLPSGSGGN